MEFFEKLAAVFGVMFLIVFCLSVRSCQCDLQSGNGINSHYQPFVGCVFEKE